MIAIDMCCIVCIAPGNGGRTDKYVWTQTLSEVTMNVPLPLGVTKKQLEVDLRNSHLKVHVSR